MSSVKRQRSSTKKSTKNKDGPKKPKSAFLYYMKAERDNVKKANPSLSFGDVAKQLGAQWKALRAEHKAKYEALAKGDQERYAQENEARVNLEKQRQAAHSSSDGSEDEDDVRNSNDDDDGEEEEAPSSNGKNGKRRQRTKDENAPKRAVTAYFHYAAKQRPLVRAKHPELSFGDVAKAISAKWQKLGEDERAPYERLAEEDRNRYREERNAYVALGKPGKKASSSVEKPKAKRQATNAPQKRKPAHHDSSEDDALNSDDDEVFIAKTKSAPKRPAPGAVTLKLPGVKGRQGEKTVPKTVLKPVVQTKTVKHVPPSRAPSKKATPVTPARVEPKRPVVKPASDDTDRPRPRTPFQCFESVDRFEVRRANPGLKPSKIAELVEERWDALAHNKRVIYEKMAARERATFAQHAKNVNDSDEDDDDEEEDDE